MKKHFLLPFLLLVAGLLIFSACRRKKEPACSGDPNQCQSVLEAKDYFAFKLGTWWVYEEENSGDRDSVYVTESSIDPYSYQFNVRMYSTYQNCYYHYWPVYYGGTSIPSCSETQPVDKKCLYVRRSKYGTPEQVTYESDCFFVSYKIGEFSTTGGGTNCPNNKIIIDDIIYDDFIVLNQHFNKTIKIHDLCTHAEGDQPTNFYYSKGAGITKKEFIDSNQVWNLVNYHIEP